MAQGNMRDLQISIPFLHPRFYPFPNHFIMKPDSWNWDLCIALFLVHICLSTAYPHTHTHTLRLHIDLVSPHTCDYSVHTRPSSHAINHTQTRNTKERERHRCSTGRMRSTLTQRNILHQMTLKFSRIQPRITLTKLEDIWQQWNRTESLSKASTNEPLSFEQINNLNF